MATTFNGDINIAKRLQIKRKTEAVTCSGATSSASNIIPAGATVLGVNVNVTTAVEGASAFTIGDGTDADRWGTAIAIAAGTKTDSSDYVAGGAIWYGSATSVVLTATTSDFTAGVVLVEVVYFEVA